MMRDRLGNVIYVGKAKDLKKRVSSYFRASGSASRSQQPKIAAMIKLAFDIDVIEVKSEAEALILEGRFLKDLKPKYNTDFKDDKRFLLVRVDTQNPLPQFHLTRNRTYKQALYFGPFANPSFLRKTLSELRLKFGILLGDARPKKIDPNTYRLYDDARSEIYGHPNVVTVREYAERVERACQFMEGKLHSWKEDIEKKMHASSQKRNYEKAAELRDILFALKKTLEPSRKFTRQLPLLKEREAPLEDLKSILSLDALPRHIECFDISHISGTFVVASLVRFKEGVPQKSQYRRFKIKSFVGNDDFKAMQEVVSRRYTRLHSEKKAFPDLILIDGGQGQIHAALKAFAALNLKPPMLIGLAKKKETIVFADGRPPLNLAFNNPALKLLQRVRDEAHRFANAFNAELRSKRIQESILDSFSGLGPVRKQALLDHFKSLKNLCKATEEVLQEVPGIGPKMAAQLRAFLRKNV